MRKSHSGGGEHLRLYHFTNLICLPGILAEGITTGELPLENVPYRDRSQAPSLSRKPSHEAQRCWAKSQPTDKTRVRLTVALPMSNLTTFREIRKEYRLRSRWVKALAPAHEHFDWFFALDGVQLEQIKKVEVALIHPGDYTELREDEVSRLIEFINSERSKLEFGTDSEGRCGFRVIEDCLLIDGPSHVGVTRYPPIPLLLETQEITNFGVQSEVEDAPPERMKKLWKGKVTVGKRRIGRPPLY